MCECVSSVTGEGMEVVFVMCAGCQSRTVGSKSRDAHCCHGVVLCSSVSV